MTPHFTLAEFCSSGTAARRGIEQWRHTSWRMPAVAIDRVVTTSRAGTVPGIVEV